MSLDSRKPETIQEMEMWRAPKVIARAQVKVARRATRRLGFLRRLTKATGL
jgi:hypothetical protein